MPRYARPSYPEEIYHWGLSKGAKADDHKYVMRIVEGKTNAGLPKYRYFYTMDEYNAYRTGKTGNDTVIKYNTETAKTTKTTNTTNNTSSTAVQTKQVTKTVTDKAKMKKYEKVADKVINGDYGDGEERKKKLKKAGYDYDTAQNMVNHKVKGTKLDKSKYQKKKTVTVDQNGNEVKATSNTATGTTTKTVTDKAKMKKYEKVADKVINGDYGNGGERKSKLKKAGYDYDTAQNMVNHKLKGTKLDKSKYQKKVTVKAKTTTATADSASSQTSTTTESKKQLPSAQTTHDPAVESNFAKKNESVINKAAKAVSNAGKSATNNVMSFLSNGASKTSKAVATATKTVANTAEDVAEKAAPSVAKASNEAAKTAKTATKNVMSFLSSSSSKAAKTAAATAKTIDEKTKISDIVSNAGDSAKTAVNTAANKVKSGVSEAGNAIADTARSIDEKTHVSEIANEVSTEARNKISSFMNKVESEVSEAMGRAKTVPSKVAKEINSIKKEFLVNTGLVNEKNDTDVPKSFDNLKHIGSEESDEDAAKSVNPDYNPLSYAYSQNCAYCSAAYDMRKRGYDVTASHASMYTANSTEEIESWYDGGKFSTVENQNSNKEVSAKEAGDNLSKKLMEQKEHARGMINLWWKNGGGHNISYEIKDGSVVYIDTQTGKEVNIYSLMKYADTKKTEYMETDNLKPSDKILSAVRNKSK